MHGLSLEPDASTKYAKTAGAVPSIANLLTGTIILLHKPSGYGSARVLFSTNSNTFGFRNLLIGTTGGTNAGRFAINRDTANLVIEVTKTDLPYLNLNEELWWAASWNTAGADTDQHFYGGSLNNPLTEPASYFNRTAGSGTVLTAAANPASIGNPNTGVSPPTQEILVAIWGSQIPLKDLRDFTSNPRPQNNMLGYWLPGENGTGTIWDWVGGNHMTITSATPTSDFMQPVKRWRR